MRSRPLDPDARELRSAVRAELRALLLSFASTLGAPVEGYSSRKGHEPPGYERRAWQALARAIGVRRGRWWYVSREALAAHEAARQPAVAPSPTPAAADYSSDALARRLGLRLVGGG